METAEEIYSNILNALSLHLYKVNPNLAPKANKRFLKKLDIGGIKYELTGEGIKILGFNPDNQKAFFNAIIAYAQPFEDEYGLNETWRGLRPNLMNSIYGVRQPIRLMGIEIPISAYKMIYAFFDNLIAVNASGFRKINWFEGVVTITNHRLLFQGKNELLEIPLQTIATVGREIYLVYTGTTAKGIMKAIDYMDPTKATMSCALVLAKEDWMRDFVETARIMRNDYRKLSSSESRMVVALYNEAFLKEMGQVMKTTPEQVREAYNRLKEMKYIDATGHLTSYGLNAAVEVMEREKLITFEKGEDWKDEVKSEESGSREL